MSPAKDLGTRHTCWKCSTKFYDLKKPVPICPRCGADQRESPALKEPPKAVKKAAAPAIAPDLDEHEESFEDEEESFEDDEFEGVDEDEVEDY